MEKCLIIINNIAGKSDKISFEKVEKCLGKNFVYTHFALPEDGEYSLDGYDAVAVCGGDGTLGAMLGKAYTRDIDVYYFPAGTLNDRAKSKRYDHAKSPCPACDGGVTRKSPVVLGKFRGVETPAPSKDGESEENVFSYVLAAGSFTPIGYIANIGLKKKLGVFAYILQVLKEYRVHRIPAVIDCGDAKYEGDFTLIMALKSPRCFGFRFNRDFDPESESGHLIAIRSPKRGGIFGIVSMFFPFFKVFFMGLRKERDGKIIFKRIRSCKISHGEKTTYCRDGDRYDAPKGELEICFEKSRCNFIVIDKY